MKFPITDQFLWLIYNYAEKISTPLDIFKIRTFSQVALIGEDFWKNIERKRSRKQFAQFVYYLKKNGYIKIKENQGVLLTLRGKEKCFFLKHRLGDRLKKRKDGKWIMVVFDIPERMRKYRDDFRRFLTSLGFKKFQKSIWVCPYDVLKDLREIINFHSLDRFIKIFIVQEVELE